MKIESSVPESDTYVEVFYKIQDSNISEIIRTQMVENHPEVKKLLMKQKLQIL
ncbi:hypothetical protein QUF55_00705 [Clostridiaceae bacterium HSG29]|nr:hypothetical protein [Clostridiaceae bacterium HSG29]